MTGPPALGPRKSFQAADNLAPTVLVRAADGQPAGCLNITCVPEMIKKGLIKPLGERKLGKLLAGELKYVQFTSRAPWRRPERSGWAGRDNTQRMRNDQGTIISPPLHVEPRPLPPAA